MNTRRLALLAVGAAAVSAPVAAHAFVFGPIDAASIGPEGRPPVSDRQFGGTSADGKLIALQGAGPDLDPADANPHADIYVTKRGTREFELISKTNTGGPANGKSTIRSGAISADGDRVAFTSEAGNLAPNDANLRSDVFVFDRSDQKVTVLSHGPTEFEADGNSFDATISSDGSKVAFVSEAPNLVLPMDLNGFNDVYVRDVDSNVISLQSVTNGGAPANGPSWAPALSADGTKLAFVSSATNLVAGDTNGKADVFVRDTVTGTTKRVSLSDDEQQGAGDSGEPTISADGNIVAFSTKALLGGLKYAGTSAYDVYVRDIAAGTTERIIPEAGLEHGRGNLGGPSLSADGRFVSFTTSSNDTFGNDGNYSDVYVVDRALNEFSLVTIDPAGRGANASSAESELADSGVGIAFRSAATNLSSFSSGSQGLQIFARSVDPAAYTPGDLDGDGVGDIADRCPKVADDQSDVDGEGRGDACDRDDDSDSIVDELEPENQGSDALKFDSDGDGVNDFTDDYAGDADRTTGTSHQTLNVATFDIGTERPASAELLYDEKRKRFKLEAEALLPEGTSSATLYAIRRADGIRNQPICLLRPTQGTRVARCASSSLRLSWFTDLVLKTTKTSTTVKPLRPLTSDAE